MPLGQFHRRGLQVEKLEERALLAARVWDGGGADNLWSTPGNWAGDVAPVAGDDLIFAPSAAQLTSVNDLPAETTFNTITFTGGGYTVTAGNVRLYGGLTANNLAGNNAIDFSRLTLVNAQSIMSANTGTTLTVGGVIDTANLVGATNIFGTSALTLDGAGTLAVTASIVGAGSIYKLGPGRAILSGSNAHEGVTDVRQGILRAASNMALGLANTGETQIQPGAQLEIAGSVTIAEHFAIREGGVGFGTATSTEGLGAISSFSGNNVITGNIDLAGGNNLIGVDTGSSLDIQGAISDALSETQRMIKVGGGTLRLSGSLDNIYRGETRVLEGTLELAKEAGKLPFAGNLIIGDDIQASGTKTVRLINDDQIPQLDYFAVALTTVEVRSTGVLDFNGQSDTIGNLTLVTGQTDSADVVLGGGTLTLGGSNITVNAFQGSSGATPAATISGGTLDLGTFFSGAGGGVTKTFAVNDTQLANIATDLNVSADIVGSADVSFTRTGAGTMRFSGDNSGLASLVVLNGGIHEVASNQAFGTNLLSLQGDATLVAFGAARTVATPVSIDSNPIFIGQNDLTFSGPITLTGGRIFRIMDPAQTLVFAGPVGESIFGSSGIDKRGHGTLALEAANTYSGATTVNEDGGTIVLRKAGSILNSPSNLTINPNATLIIDNSEQYVADRINDATTINFFGTIKFIGNDSEDAFETIGPLNTNSQWAHNIIVENNSGGAFQSVLIASSFGLGSDRTINFQGIGEDLSVDGPNRFSVINFPGGLDDAMIQATRITSASGEVDFATYVGNDEGFAVVAIPAAAYVTDLALAGPTSNVRLAAGTYHLTTSKVINSLLLEPGVTITGDDVALVVNSGNVVFLGEAEIAVDNVILGIGSSVAIHTAAEGEDATISGNWITSGGNVLKGGRGRLILSGDNQFGNNLVIGEGIVTYQSSTAGGAAGAGTFIRQGATLELDGSGGDLNIGLELIEMRSNAGFIPGGGGDYAQGYGAVRNVAGDNRLAGTVQRRADNSAVAMIAGLLAGLPVNVSAMVFVDVAADSSLTITGSMNDGSSNPDLIKRGGGTLVLAGLIPSSINQNVRILEGTLVLDQDPGLNPINGGTIFIGTDAPGAPEAVLRLANSDQIADGQPVQVHSSGRFELDGHSDVIAALNLVVSAQGAGQVDIGDGGLLTPNGNTTVFTVGRGHDTGASITGGTFALQLFGVIAGAGTRTFQVNDGTDGVDLTITSAIVDGTGLQSVGIIKTGFGTLELGGEEANTLTGDTTVSEGTLLLNKGSGDGGVSAIMGRLFIGDNSVQSGYGRADVVRWLQPDQLPDFLAAIEVRNTGWMDLNGHSDAIGQADGQTALTMRAASFLTTGDDGLLIINGNIAFTNADGAGLWTPVAPGLILGRIDIGSISRTIDIGGDRSDLAVEAVIAAEIGGTGGLIFTNTGTLLLAGENTYSGDTVRTNGNLAIASNQPFGQGRFFMNGGHLVSYNGAHEIPNESFLTGTISFVAGNGAAGSGALGGGGNDIRFTGPVQLANNVNFIVNAAGTLEFAGGIGETLGGFTLAKSGFGRMVISGASWYSGATTINDQGGHLILRGAGSATNTVFTVGYGGVLELDKSAANIGHQVGDLNNAVVESAPATVTLNGGTLALVGRPGAASTEIIGNVFISDNRNGAIQSIVSPAAGSSATWRINNVLRNSTANFAPFSAAHVGSQVNFVARGVEFGATTSNKLVLSSPEALMSGILPFAVITAADGDLEFATYVTPAPVTSPFDHFLEALTSGPNFSTTLAGATLTTNVKLTRSGATTEEAATAGQVVNALLLDDGFKLTGGPLVVRSGLIAAQGTGNEITASISIDQSPNAGFNSMEALVYVAPLGSLAISAPIAENTLGVPTHLSKAGPGRLLLSGDNDFSGVTRVTDGVLAIAHSNALGRAATAVTNQVFYGGSLELAGDITVPATKSFQIRGNGEANVASVPLRNAAGVNTLAGNVDLQNNRTGLFIAEGSELILTGIVSNQGFNQLGRGILELGGTANNTFAVTSIVWQGTLELNKTAGTNAIPTMNDNNEFFVGNVYGLDNSVVLRSLASDQIGDGPHRLRIMPSGQFNLGGFSETIIGRTGAGNNHDVLSLDIGANGSGSVDLGGGTLRIGNTVADNGRVQVRIFSGGLPLPATIANGTLELMGATALTRRILVDDSAGVDDLVITATIADGGAAPTTFIKNNNGRLVLAPSAAGGNTFTAPVTIEQGELVVRGANPLGASSAGTTVNSGTALLIDGVSAAEPLNLNGTGFNGRGAVVNLSGDNTWTGNITLAGATTFGVFAGTNLDLEGIISGAQNLVKLLPGTLEYSGSTVNTYTGRTNVFEGTLLLNKSVADAAIAGGVVQVSNDAGGKFSDILRFGTGVPQQIAAAAAIEVTPAGLLDLNGNNETLGGTITFFNGVAQSGEIRTGAGTLTIGNSITVNAAGGVAATTASPGARVTGNLNLGNAARTFTANDVGVSIQELIIDATVHGGGATGAITSSGGGLLVLNGNNSANLSGTTTISGGAGIVVGHNSALGTGALNITGNTNLFTATYGAAISTITLANNITLGADLTLRGDKHLTINGNITNVGGNRVLTSNVSIAAQVTLAGTINLSNDATGRTLTINNNTFAGAASTNAAGGAVIVSGQIVDSATTPATVSLLTKGGTGLVVLSNNTNSYKGTTTVAAGVVRLTSNNALGGSVAEQQTFTVNSAGGGSFTITFGQTNTLTTTALAYTGTTPPTATAVADALNALANIGGMGGVASVASSNPTGPNTTYTVTFGGLLSGIDTPTMTVNVTGVTLTTAAAQTVAGTGGTTVNAGATLQLEPGLTIAEALRVSGTGVGNLGSLRLRDVTPGTSDTTTVSGHLSLDQSGTVGVDVGGPNGDTLITTGGILSGNQIIKLGRGTWEIRGAADNFLNPNAAINSNGWDDGIDMRAGTLLFNKTGSGRGIGAGTITIGDGGGGDNADRIVFAGTGTDAIPDGLTVTLGASGLLQFSGTPAETFTALVLVTGQAYSADVATGAGILNVTNITVNTFAATDGDAPAAVIDGTITVTGTFTVNDTFVPSLKDDLEIVGQFLTPTITPVGDYFPGLREGRIANNSFDISTPNPGNVVQLQPRAGQQNTAPPWADNVTWVYTGQFFDADGIFTFAENVDDSVLIRIDGSIVLQNGAWDVATSTALTDGLRTQNGTEGAVVAGANTGTPSTNFGMGPLGDGWHDIEIRFGNGSGGAGPPGQIAGGVDTGWATNFGFGLNAGATPPADANGLNFIRPIDPGDATLFRTLASEINAAAPIPSASALNKNGTGTLNVRSAIAVHAATVSAGTLRLSDDGALAAAQSIIVSNGATLVLDNSNTVADRLNDGMTVGLTGGALSLIGHETDFTDEFIGSILLAAASGQTNIIRSTMAGGGNFLTSTGLIRTGDAFVRFEGIGSDIGDGDNQIDFLGGANPFVNGVLPYATIAGPAGFDLVTDGDGDPTAGPFSINRVFAYDTDINTPNGIVRLDGTEPPANRVLSGPNTIAALLLENGVTVSGSETLTVGSATSALVVSLNGNNVISTNMAFGGRNVMAQTLAGSLELSGSLTGTATLRKEGAGTLILSGDNTLGGGYTGAIQAQQGTLVARHSGAFGTTGGGVNVLAEAMLVLEGNLSIGNEQLDLAGSASQSAINDTLRVNGNVTWGTGGTVVNYNSTTFVDVLAEGVLSLNAAVGGGGQLVKVGPGELVYLGNDNANTQVHSINQGTFTMNKAGAARAIRNTLNVNDPSNFDPFGSALARFGAAAGTNQIDNNTVTVNLLGTFDLANVADSIGALNVSGGTVLTGGANLTTTGVVTITGGSIDTGAGNLILGNNITYNSGPTGGTAATIRGNLDLGNATRTITVNDGYFAANDLTIEARMFNGRVIKNGGGALLLTNAGNAFQADVNESAVMTVSASVTSFTLNLNAFNQNLTTPAIPFAAASTTAADIQAVLETLNNIQPGNVAVTGAVGGPYTITFQGALAGFDFANLVAAGTGGTITFANTNGATGFNLNAGTLALGHDTALGTTRLVVTAAASIIAAGGARTIANPTTIFNNFAVNLGGRRDFSGTDSLTFSGAVQLTPGNQNVTLQVDDPRTAVSIAEIAGGNGSFTLVKNGFGTLALTGASTHFAGVQANQGVLRLSHSDALGARTNDVQLVRATAAFTLTFNSFTTPSLPLGSPAADVQAALNNLPSIGGSNGLVTVTGAGTLIDPYRVTFLGALAGTNAAAMTATGATVATLLDGIGTSITSGAEIQLVGNLAIGNESLSINGQGLLNRTSRESVFVGALHAVSGDSSWGTGMTTITLGGTTYVGADADASIILNAAVSGAQAFYKVGAGTETLAGALPNTHTGNTTVFAGTLVLDKAPGLNASAGPWIVGDNVGDANSDLLILNRSEQITDAQAVTVTGSGQLRTSTGQATSATNEVQQVTVGNAALTGQFRLQFGGATTTDLALNATAAQIQSALNALSTIGGAGGNVFVTGSAAQNASFTVTFLGSLAGANQPQLKIVAGTTPFAVATLAVTTIAQGGLTGRETVGATTLRIAAQAGGNILLGSGSTLSLQGDLTVDNYGSMFIDTFLGAEINGGILELRQQSAAGAVATRNFNVNVDTPAFDDLWITSAIADGSAASFANIAKNNGGFSRLTLESANTYSGNTTVVSGILEIRDSAALGTAATDEHQNYLVNNVLGAAAGQYTITTDAGTTANLDFNASADEVQAALSALYGAGSVRVVSAISGNTNQQFFIRWTGAHAGSNKGPITLNNVSLTGATLGTVSTTQEGGVAANAQTVVNSGTTLHLGGDGLTIELEQLTLNGTGIVDTQLNALYNLGFAGSIGSGALRGISGDNTVNSNVVLNANPTAVAVEFGTTLVFGGTGVVSGGNALMKLGEGTLELGGSVANTYTGNNYVVEGTLRLNKTGGVAAIVGGEIIIGDNFGDDNADRLVFASATDQIAGDRVIRIARSGLLNFNGASETINQSIVLDVGAEMSADLATGAGTLTTNGTIFTLGQAGTTATAPAASITGNLLLNVGANALQTLDIRDSGAAIELDLQAIVSGPSNRGLLKISRGTLQLSAANTFEGAVFVRPDAGMLIVAANGALGTAIGGTSVAAFSTLAFTGDIDYTAAEPLVVAGSGRGGLGAATDFGALVNLSGDNSFAGTITFGGTLPQVLLNMIEGSLTLTDTSANAIRLLTTNLVVAGDGDLTVSGTISGTDPIATGTGLLGIYINADNAPNLRSVDRDLLAPLALLEAYAPQVLLTTPRIDFGAGTTAVPGDGNTVDRGGVAGNPYGGLGVGVDGDQIAGIWVGTITAPETALYRFTTRSDDGSLLFIDGVHVVHNNNNQGMTNRSGEIWLTAGVHTFKAATYEGGGDAGMQVSWEQLSGAGAFARRNIEPAVFGYTRQNTLTKLGEGVLTLAGDSTYAGLTTVVEGTLLAANTTGSATGTNDVIVNDGATLGGEGFITGDVLIESGGTIDPGFTPGDTGTLTVGALVMEEDATLVADISGAASDRVVTASIEIADDLTQLLAQIAAAPTAATYVIVNNTGVDPVGGSFLGLPFDPAGTLFEIDGREAILYYNYDAATNTLFTGNDIAISFNTNLAPIVRNDTFTMNEDATLNGNVVTNLVPNGADTDPEGDSFTVALVGAPPAGAFSLLPTGAFTYTPAFGFSGSVQFQYNATDTAGGISNIATVTIVINAVADAPTLSVTPATGNEDTQIPLTINGSLNDFDGSETLSFQITGVPAGATLTAGTNAGGGVWNLTAAQVSGLRITPALHSDADFTLTVIAIATDTGSLTAQTSAPLLVTVNAVADVPNLTTAAASGNEDTAIPLTITSSLVDTDGSETLAIRISNVPTGATLSAGTNAGGGVWNLSPAQLAGLTITPPLHSDVDFTLSVAAIATDTGGVTAQSTANLAVTVNAVADPPTLNVVAASGLEDTQILLGITSALVDSDSSETLAIRIIGVPTGATLSAGTNAGGGVWNLTSAQLANLRITPPLHSDAEFTLTVTATSTETAGGATASATAPLAVNVIASADAPTLTVANSSISGGQGVNIPLGLSAALVDTDGSETLTVQVVLPAGSTATIVGGTNLGGGVWNIPLANVPTAAIRQVQNSPPFNIAVNAIARETDPAANPLTATTSRVINVTIINTPPNVQLVDVLLLGDSLGVVSSLTVVPGLGITFDLVANEPVRFAINWEGTATPSCPTSGPLTTSFSATHAYGSFGTFQPILVACDADGGQTVLNAGELPLITSQKFISIGGSLYVAGSDASDRIIIQPASLGGVSIRMNNVLLPRQSVGERIVVFGNGGNDTITTATNLAVPVELYGGSGDDYLTGGVQGDTLDGGTGKDRLLGGGGHDFIYGGEGNDAINGGAGNDYLSGEEYIDLLGSATTLPGDVVESLTLGKDTINGDAGNDIIKGGAGNDILNGGVGIDYILGGDGVDKLTGGAGDDALFGGAGADQLYGNAGRDILIGGSGADTLYGSTGADLILGGDVDASYEDAQALIDLLAMWQADAEAAADTLAGSATDDTIADILHGEGDSDWYLTFALDVFKLAGEKKAPNRILPL